MRHDRLAGVTIALYLAQGCGDGDSPPWSEDSRDVGPTDSGSTDSTSIDSPAADSMSAEGLPPATELCEGIPRNEQLIDEIGVPWDPPEMLGGVLELGTYDLDQLLVFGDATNSEAGSNPENDGGSFMAPTGRSAQSTLVIERYALRRLSLWSGEQGRPDAFVYSTDGATLWLRSVCPARGTEATYGYSVVGNTLALLVDPRHLATYSKR